MCHRCDIVLGFWDGMIRTLVWGVYFSLWIFFPPLSGVSPLRNPSLKQQLFSYAILGFALSEAMGLFCLMVAFLILFAM